MTKEKQQKTKEAIDVLKDLEKLLEERIVELCHIKGGMQARHAYIFYRNKVWEAILLLQE